MDGWTYTAQEKMTRAERENPGFLAIRVLFSGTGLWSDVVMYNATTGAQVERRLFF